MGLSPVLDYIYRPYELENMCLYDWVCQCTRTKVQVKKQKKSGPHHEDIISNPAEESDNNNLSDEHSTDDSNNEEECSEPESCIAKQKSYDPNVGGIFDLLPHHPLFGTHKTRCAPGHKALVPKFIGETLPRRDQGDREWYCMTMLALFQPWRSGLDLKVSEQSWDDRFVAHKFSSRQQEVMDYFNLRYECMDARDDFHAQLKKGNAIIPSWNDYAMSGNHADSVGDEDLDEYEGTAEPLQQEIDYEPSSIGNRELKRQHAAEIIKGVMQQSGWSEASGSRLLQHKEPVKTAAQWKGDVKQMRKNILDEGKRNVVDVKESEADDVLTTSFQTVNQVKIVDKPYLERRQHSVAHKVIIDSIVIKFQLNREQERAFRIVANHASNSYSEQLKMYIGGMGGTGKTQVLRSLTEFFKITNQAKSFMVVAPTGSAAALLGGSTYHYLFGFGDRPDDKIPSQLLLQLRARFEGVNYIFLDEVSMLSCHDMYRISFRLSKILNVSDFPFGGIRVRQGYG